MSGSSKSAACATPLAPKHSYEEALQSIRRLLKKRLPLTVVFVIVLLVLSPYIVAYLNRRRVELEIPATKRTLGIKELVGDVKSELSQLENERIQNNEKGLFEVTDFELEISFLAQASSRQNGKIEYSVITADSDVQHAVEKIQKLTLHLKTIEDTEPNDYPGSEAPSNPVSNPKDKTGPPIHPGKKQRSE